MSAALALHPIKMSTPRLGNSAPFPAGGRAITPSLPCAHVTDLRAQIEIHGAVQGVGFRPFVYRLATELDLRGWVINDASGVFIEAEGPESRLRRFVERLGSDLPTVASIDTLDVEYGDPVGFSSFDIRHSDGAGPRTAIILPDLATCGECLAETLDPGDRRFGYPFTNCTNCGPRFSIIRDLPYDRPNTTMAAFDMCEPCSAEYVDPGDRRFHAQPNACPTCGPRIAWVTDEDGAPPTADEALAAAIASLAAGEIVAVKGLGGYQLLTDATSEAAVDRLRTFKARPHKPFAVMVGDLEAAHAIVEIGDAAEDLLTSTHAPIVLAARLPSSTVSELVAPDNPTLGVMLPTTPLHHLLLRAWGGPVVATSGNLSDEPICIDDAEAHTRLGSIADGFLVHDRPIERHVDDSVTWVIEGEARLLRRARGYAPMPVTVHSPMPNLVATGAHLKNTIAVSVGRNVFVSQHVGDLETAEAQIAFGAVVDDLTRMYGIDPVAVAHDLHPDYPSTRFALDLATGMGVRSIGVQHHHAHLASCLADNDDEGPALGVTWDGTGYGTDGTIWGGEFLLGDAAGFDRVGHLLPFRLPGGDAAVREPRRSAAGVLHAAGLTLDPATPGLASFADNELGIVAAMLDRGINAPTTTSAGRLFDAVAAMAIGATASSFEGQAAMALEHVADRSASDPYPIDVDGTAPIRVVDWRPTIAAILTDIASGTDASHVSGRFHATMTDAIVAVAVSVGHGTVALSGGCFQNRLLTETTARRLRDEGFKVLLHRRVPPNDGGISLGQTVVAAAALRDDEPP